MTTTEPQLFDVLIYETETRKVVSVEGSKLRRHASGGDYSRSADRLVEDVMNRLTKAFHKGQFVGVFPAGQFKKGDVLPTEEES